MLLSALNIVAMAMAMPVMALPASRNITDLFAPVLSAGAEIFLPGDSDYDQVTPRWSTFREPSYVAAIKPATEEDVGMIVRTATAHDVPFLATGGGHGVKKGFAAIQSAINIDLSNLKSAELDLDQSSVTVGSGVENSQLYDLLASVRKETPLTAERCINTVGPTLGGGLGPLYGIHGLTLDALEAVRLVTADGELLTVSSEEHPDLFWAIRGAGANFGIVTSATYRIFDQTNGGNRLHGTFQFASASNLSVFELLRSWDDYIPAELFLGVHLSYNQTSHEGAIAMTFDFTGSESAAKPYLDQIRDLNPIQQSVKVIPWHNRQPKEPAACERGKYTSLYTLGLRRTSPMVLAEYFHNLTDFASENTWCEPTIMWQRLSLEAVMADSASSRGAFPWRDTKVNVGLSTTYPGPEYDNKVNGFVKPIRDRLNEAMGYDTLHVYVNEAIGDEGAEAWYGKHNLKRLGTLKSQWDPNNLFGGGAPVPQR